MGTIGQRYAETIKSNSGKSAEHKIARQKACIDYKAAKKTYENEKPALLKKEKEEQEELTKTKEEREVNKKAKKLAKNKVRREKQAKLKATESVIAPVLEPVNPVQAVDPVLVPEKEKPQAG